MVLKGRDNKREVKNFTFGSLSPDYSSNENATSYKLQSLNDTSAFKNNISEQVIRAERKAENKTGFSIDKTVRELRGLTKQEASDIEQAVVREVEARLAKLKVEAEKKGYEAGRVQGNEKAYVEAVEKYNQSIEEFTQWIDGAKGQLGEILNQAQQESYHMIKNLVKWIVLKEVNDKDYIPRLLEKMILEINIKSNLVIRVNETSFQDMDDVLKIVQTKVGALSNTRVETHLDLNTPGIVLESENGIIDGSLEAQFSTLDRIFETVTKNHDS